MEKRLTIYIKPTNYCPVGCTHCYLPKKIRTEKNIMTMSVLEKISEFISKFQERRNFSEVLIYWHGGEPFSIPVKWYYDAKAVLDKYFKSYTESVQTSLLTIKHEHIPLIKTRFDNIVGISVDFSLRMIKGSNEKYLKKLLEKVEFVREKDINVIPIMVPSKNELGKEEDILSWFEKNQFNSFLLERYNDFGRKGELEDRPTNQEYSSFLINIFNGIMTRMEKKQKAPVVKNIVAGINGVVNFASGDKWGTDCFYNTLVFEPDGSINNCPDKSGWEEPCSNVHDGYYQYISSKKLNNWIRHSKFNHPMNCFSCKYYSWCKSGCPINYNDSSDECKGYYNFLNFVEKSYLKNPDLIKNYLSSSKI